MGCRRHDLGAFLQCVSSTARNISLAFEIPIPFVNTIQVSVVSMPRLYLFHVKSSREYKLQYEILSIVFNHVEQTI